MDRKLIEYKKLKFSYNPEFSNKGFLYRIVLIMKVFPMYESFIDSACSNTEFGLNIGKISDMQK